LSAKIKKRLFNDRLFIIVVMLSLLTIASVFTDHSKQKPVSEFSVTPTSGNAPLNITFTDKSTGNPLYKWWGFGDGTGSSLNANTINHTYFKAGKYKVYLVATNAEGSDKSEFKNITVNEIFYKFDPNNGNDGKSPWGKSLVSLPSYKGYHLPAKEGYILVENQYNFIDDTTSNYLDSDPTDGNGFYISTLSPDKGHWSWNGSYTPDIKNNISELIPGSQDHVSIEENGTRHMPSGKGVKVSIYSPYTKMTVIAVVGGNGPAPWTGCQFGASNKVFKALGLPDSYNGSSKENPNPGHGSNMSDPGKFPVIKYADNPYWVEVSWADQSLPAGPLISSNKSR
jgi:PKD repeat protein